MYFVVSWPPSPGGPGEGPDGQYFRKIDRGFGAASGPNPRVDILFFLLAANFSRIRDHPSKLGFPAIFWNGFWGRRGDGFWGRRGRPDPKNRRFPAVPKTMYSKPFFAMQSMSTDEMRQRAGGKTKNKKVY